MEATVIVALVSGLVSVTGIALQVIERVKTSRLTLRSQDRATEIAADEAAARRLDDRNDKYIARIEKATERAELDLDEMRKLYTDALHRFDELLQVRAEDQSTINDLQAQLRRIQNT